MESGKYFFILTLLLITVFSDISACGSRHGRRHHSSHHSSGGFGHGFWRPSSHHSSSSYSPSHSSSSSHTNSISSHDSHPTHTSSNAQASHPSHDSHPSSHVNHDSGSHHSSDYSPPAYVPIHINPFPRHHHRHHNVVESSNQPASTSGFGGQNTAIQNEGNDSNSSEEENDSNSSEEEIQNANDFNPIETDIRNIVNSLNVEANDKTSTTVKPMPKVDVSWLQLSCEEGLCEFTKNYPLKEVESAVQEMKNILFANSLNSMAENNINSNVQDYFSKPNRIDYDIKTVNTTQCQEAITSASPLGGYDINGRPFIIVNIPSLIQEVKIRKCNRPFDICGHVYSDPYPWCCHGFDSNKELLVLPAKQGSFNHTEFSVETFKVPGGCQCTSFKQILDFNLFR